MSKITNEPKIRNPLIVGIREQLEHRALWMYLLIDEAEKHGLKSEEFAPDAIRRCGLYHGANHRIKGGMGNSLKGLKKALFGTIARQVFEMDILRCDDDHLDIDFHYCPLVKAWQKQGCTDEQIAKLCDHAMCGDRGIGESFGVELDLPGTIANGDPTCQIRFVRREGSADTAEAVHAWQERLDKLAKIDSEKAADVVRGAVGIISAGTTLLLAILSARNKTDIRG
jgi:hypothetical protein